MKIVCVEPLGMSEAFFESKRAFFAQTGDQFSYYMTRCEEPAVLVERMHDADVVIVSNIRLTAATLEQCPHLRMLSVAFTGLDHIDLEYCKQRGIRVRNAAGYSTTAVSELAIGLMIDLLRQTVTMDRATRNGEGRGTCIGGELRGRTVGVVGTGAIGTATIRLLQAFGCHVIAYNRSVHEAVTAMGVPYVDLDTLMQRSDIVTLHVPMTADTRHLIDARRLAMMQSHALLVNTARGGVVDTDALAAALREGRIAGAATDVYDNEPPLPTDHPLLQAPHCICLPHIGFTTREAFDIRADIVFKELHID